MITTFRTVLHGRTIELPWDLGLPEGHVIEVTIKTRPDVESTPEPPLPWWVERLEVNPAVVPGKFVIKGTRLRADALVELLEAGKSDQELLRAHPELTPEDVSAVREYAKLPVEMRRSFGAWAEDAEELDKFLEWNRQQRRASHREIED
jgi:uncharacterized protein (DUF433 family)